LQPFVVQAAKRRNMLFLVVCVLFDNSIIWRKMKKSKRNAALFLTTAMAVSMAACGAVRNSLFFRSFRGSRFEASSARRPREKPNINATDTTFAPSILKTLLLQKIGIDMDLILPRRRRHYYPN
jgi:hypothetical protein